MSAAPPSLTFALLDDLYEQWARQDAPIIRALRPGLSNDEIDQLTDPLPLRLPDEVRLWWVWHDGTRPGAGVNQNIGGYFWYAPLEKQVAAYHFQRALAMEVGEAVDDDQWADTVWPPQMFPITEFSNGDNLMCDCSGPRDGPAPIYLNPHDDGPESSPRARSFGELVAWWIQVLASGGWRWVRDQGRWLYDETRTPPEPRNAFLA